MKRTSIRGLEPVERIDCGMAYRFVYYDGGAKSHLVNRYDQDVTYCGRIVWPEPNTMDSAGIENWIVYPEQRSRPSVCGPCKEGEKKWSDAQAAASRRPQALYEAQVHPDDLLLEARRMLMSAKVVITGSRSITDPEYIGACLREAWEVMGPFTVLHHGGAHGVDRVAASIVKDNVDVIEHPADWDLDGKAAGIIRNAAMLDTNPDYVIVIWDGESNGTEHAWDLAKTRQIPFIAFLPGGKSINKTGVNEYATHH